MDATNKFTGSAGQEQSISYAADRFFMLVSFTIFEKSAIMRKYGSHEKQHGLEGMHWRKILRTADLDASELCNSPRPYTTKKLCVRFIRWLCSVLKNSSHFSSPLQLLPSHFSSSAAAEGPVTSLRSKSDCENTESTLVGGDDSTNSLPSMLTKRLVHNAKPNTHE